MRAIMMLQREVKRVPMDFTYPLYVVWAGYCNPFYWTHENKLSEEVKEKYGELFENIEPPVGDGYQLWETVSEGSPVSPVFGTVDELCEWLSKNKREHDICKHFTKDDWIKALNDICPALDIATNKLVTHGDLN